MKLIYVILLILCLTNVNAILINEIYPNPINSESYGEFLELYNPSNDSIDISNWYIEDHNSIEITIPENTILKPLSYFLITDKQFNLNKDNQSWPSPDLEDSLSLTNKDSGLILKDNNKQIIDKVGYGNTEIFEEQSLPQPQEGLSFQRISNTDNNLNDFILEIPTPMNQEGVSVNQLNTTNQIINNTNTIQIIQNNSTREIQSVSTTPNQIIIYNNIYITPEKENISEEINEAPLKNNSEFIREIRYQLNVLILIITLAITYLIINKKRKS